MTQLRRTLAPIIAAVALTTVVGCTAFDRGADQGEPVVDAVTDCPDLTGSFALQSVDVDGNPLPEADSKPPADLGAGLFQPASRASEGPGPLSQYAAVTIRPVGTHAIELQFARDFGQVMASLDAIRQDQRPRYAEWYRLMQPEGRAAFVAQHGEAARAARLRELGPDTGRRVVLERNSDYTCENGWVLLPREQRAPVRMTLDPGGHIVFESKEFSTFDVPVWCGDGCRSLSIPTGAYLGTQRWRRDASIRAWEADDVAQRFVFARPADEVEQEQASFARNARRSAERQFADPAAVRAALQPLLPEGVSLAEIDLQPLPFLGYRMRVRAVPSDPALDSEAQAQRLEWFLAALKDGDPGSIEDREVVKRVISSGGVLRHEVEIFLDTHPAVQPDPADQARVLVAFTPAPAAPAAPETLASPPTPAGLAEPDVVRGRMVPQVAEGCRIDTLGYSGSAVRVVGHATSTMCISQTMRSLDTALREGDDEVSPRVELVLMAAEPEGGYRFELRVASERLTKA